ncbi:MAG: aromatic acid decarboxylase [Burkholderiales bacterium]|jgi:4-hydroxy-3-polyprenylbenzoate decarboxylase|nr:aromatic acid decarboxylase [Burkholderiales bacterium]
MKNITLGITGATGIPLAFTLLKQLLELNSQVHLVITSAGIITANQETGISLSANPNTTRNSLIKHLNLINCDNLYVYTNNDWYAPMASGTNVSDAMVICPCSMASLGKIASGIGDDLLCRAADVILKERKNLILVPRETPLSAIHLANMQKLAALQVCILPPMPAFYTHPKSVQDIVDFIVGRILDQLGLTNSLVKPWGCQERAVG